MTIAATFERVKGRWKLCPDPKRTAGIADLRYHELLRATADGYYLMLSPTETMVSLDDLGIPYRLTFGGTH